MNKQRFNKALKETKAVQEDIQLLKELQRNFPYAQSIHVMVALALKQRQSDQAGNALNFAAMYVADRNNLKDIFSNGNTVLKPAVAPPVQKPEPVRQEKQVADPSIQESKKAAIEELKQKVLEKAEKNTSGIDTSPSEVHPERRISPTLPGEEDDFRERLLKELETLQASKKKWGTDHGHQKAPEEKTAPKTKDLKEKKAGKSRKENKKSSPEKSTSVKKKPKTDNPEKIKKQQELISRFIQTSPSLKAKANKPPVISAEQEDLSAKSTSFKDNLISENLAEIMISQGKNDKAIEIYKKLIWKFPQKKAYFAARIEELTKQQG